MPGSSRLEILTATGPGKGAIQPCVALRTSGERRDWRSGRHRGEIPDRQQCCRHAPPRNLRVGLTFLF
jgi:hypothetical protein